MLTLLTIACLASGSFAVPWAPRFDVFKSTATQDPADGFFDLPKTRKAAAKQGWVLLSKCNDANPK